MKYLGIAMILLAATAAKADCIPKPQPGVPASQASVVNGIKMRTGYEVPGYEYWRDVGGGKVQQQCELSVDQKIDPLRVGGGSATR